MMATEKSDDVDHGLRAEIWLALEALKPMAEALQSHMVRFYYIVLTLSSR